MKIEIKRENLTLRGLLEGTDNPHPVIRTRIS